MPLPTTTSLLETEAACATVAVAPRVSLSDIEGKIAFCYSTTANNLIPNGEVYPTDLATMTLCVVVMSNGFTVIGKSAPASPENFKAELGVKLAYEDAIQQLWPLEGYLLRERLNAAD